METIGSIMKDIKVSAPKSSKYTRFQIYLGIQNPNGGVERTRTVGVAYLQKGQVTYNIRLWTFMNERYFLLPKRDDPTRFFAMTREPSQNPNARSKHFWHIVGNAIVNPKAGVIEINLDLLSKPIYLNIFPESATNPHREAQELESLAA